MTKDDGIVHSEQEPGFELEEILAQVTEENLHAEVDTGQPVGNEIW
jgi:antitoxin component of MazEF toxin-antitoxin module